VISVTVRALLSGAVQLSRSVDEDLRDIAAADAGPPRRDVTIIGAGMAGLTAAVELEALGHGVRIFEASGRRVRKAHAYGIALTSTARAGPSPRRASTGRGDKPNG
jgi:hypothetical protein